MINLHQYFQSLIPKSRQIIEIIQEEHDDGYPLCMTLANQPIKALGTAGRSSGEKVYIEIDPSSGAKIIGNAPDVPIYNIEIF